MATVSTTLPSDGQTIDASDVNTPINAILSEFNGNIDDNNIKTGANINGAKLLAGSLPGSTFDTTLASGWLDLADTPDTVTNNGNRSYDLVFNSTDLTDTVSEGMRLRTTRTVSAPTQCADLEASSSQYFSRASGSVTGITFTDDFTCMAWVKLESYAAGGIISRFSTTGWIFNVNSSGQLVIQGTHTTGPASDFATSYQSLPLNKWTHVAASLDISGTSALIYIDGVLVPSAYTNGAQASLTQAGNLEIGSIVGGSFFDGKIAQVGLFDAVISASTIRSYMSQGLAGTETNCIGAWSLNGVLTDLDTNANTLTANGGALTTNVDSPFGNYLGGTLDYAIITKTAFSTNTTLTVQVPEGCTIPTSGGVSAVAYSTQSVPYGFVRDEGRWRLSSLLRTASTVTSNANFGSFISNGYALTVPVGSWKVGHTGGYTNSTTTTVTYSIHDTALTGLTAGAANDIGALNIYTKSAAAANTVFCDVASADRTLTSAATFVMYTAGATTGSVLDGAGIKSEIFAEFNLL